MKQALTALCLALACSGSSADLGAAVVGASPPSPEATPRRGPRSPSSSPRVASEREPSSASRAASEREPSSASPGAAAASDPLDVIAAELRALPADPAPAHTTNDTHYLVSNERRHDLFEGELRDRGGVMLGVGSDQSYVMAPWSRTELLVIVDFDQKIVDLHAIHGALMGVAPTVAEFRRLWSEAGADDAREVLRAAFDEAAGREGMVALYDEARDAVDARLRKLARRYEELGVHSYLDTPADYRFVADLHARGRVVALRGDFTQDGVLREVARVLTEHAQPVEVLYLSNIEQYFAYRRPFKDNMLALPFSDDTQVLRTLPGRPAGFHYIVQRGEDFHAWMRAPKVWSVYRIRGFTKGEPLEANKRFVAGPPP